MPRLPLVHAFASCMLTLAASAVPAHAGPVPLAPRYSPAITFKDAIAPTPEGPGITTVSLTFDGTSYWSAAGGSAEGVRYARYDADGRVLQRYSPGRDFRSLFTDASGTVFARPYDEATIYRQTTPGTFRRFRDLQPDESAPLDSQSAVVLDAARAQYVAQNGGRVSRWDLAGKPLPAIDLEDFGTVVGEDDYPQNRGLAAFADGFLTYSNGTLSVFDAEGRRTGTTRLLGAGTSFDSHFSLSYANDMVFVVDEAGGTWRGYDLAEAQTIPLPPGAAPAFVVLGAFITARRWQGYGRRSLPMAWPEGH